MCPNYCYVGVRHIYLQREKRPFDLEKEVFEKCSQQLFDFKHVGEGLSGISA